jgi:hypothetical protein
MNPTPSFPNEALRTNLEDGSVENAHMQMGAFPTTEQQTAFIESFFLPAFES